MSFLNNFNLTVTSSGLPPIIIPDKYVNGTAYNNSSVTIYFTFFYSDESRIEYAVARGHVLEIKNVKLTRIEIYTKGSDVGIINYNFILSDKPFGTPIIKVLPSSSVIGTLVLLDYTTTPLSANGTWSSAVDSDVNVGRIVGSVFADQIGTLYIQQSPDGTNWDVVDSYSISASKGIGFSIEKVLPYAQVYYVNGSTAQTTFRLYVYRRLRLI